MVHDARKSVGSLNKSDFMMRLDARLWHPWLRINRVLRVMLHTRWSAEAWSQVKAEFKRVACASQRDPAQGVVQLI